MSTTLAFRFPLGRYHANPWDRAVNEGESEWPPSPWRILRALVATRHTRWPDLPETVLTGLLDSLADPPSYRTPQVRHGHSRHYLPDLQHRKGETGHTDLTLDPFLAVDAHDELFVRWDVDLPDEQRQALVKLVELLPYLGRSESVCEARLVESDPVPDETWWRPGADTGSRRTRLLGVTRPVSQASLEVTTDGVRKSRKTIPPGTQWVTYTAAESDVGVAGAAQREETAPVTALRFAVTGKVSMRLENGVLMADEAHRRAGLLLKKAGIPDSRRAQILGTNGAGSDHAHAHWMPLPEQGEGQRGVRYMGIWVREGLRTEEIGALLGLRCMSGQRSDGYDVRGFPPVELLFQSAGKVEQVLPELCKPARRWRSLTPYLPVRHQKRKSLEEYLIADVAAELRYRDWPSAAAVTAIDPGPRVTDRWAMQFRRYRLYKENMSDSRPGLALQLQFTEPVCGPLMLGQLSHFGYGIFVPDED